MARTYNQECILAHALDLLGERWTLLIMRDLLLGPQRFGDLQAGLPGIGANLLSKRLKELDEAGLIETPKQGASSAQYRLTETGNDLRKTIRAMFHWSLHYFMARPENSHARDCIHSDNLKPDTVALALEMFSEDCRDDSLNYVAHVQIDDEPYTIYYMNGEMTAHRGADGPAVATVKGSVASFMKGFRMELSLEQLKKKMSFNGDEKAFNHLLRCITHDGKKKPLAKASAA